MLTARTASTGIDLASEARRLLLERNPLFARVFDAEAPRIAETSREMADRFSRGGRLLAFGQGAYATDAQHVSVEFVHPVIVGKRALPALDLSAEWEPWLKAILRPQDIVMGFGPPWGDPEVTRAANTAGARGALTLEFRRIDAATTDPFLHQEMLEILYHTLWETVHVFLERRPLAHDVGASAFLYPFLGGEPAEDTGLLDEVAASIRMKAADDARLREAVAGKQSEAIASLVRAIHQRLERGGKLILFGNGGSATDANDWAIDSVMPPQGLRPLPAISLSMEPANITAVANDIGTEAIFLRLLIAHAQPEDVAIGISTSGGSRNIVAALEEARKRQLLTVGILGYDGGEIVRRSLADHAIVVPSDYIPRIQEVQASVYHTIRVLLEVAHGED